MPLKTVYVALALAALTVAAAACAAQDAPAAQRAPADEGPVVAPDPVEDDAAEPPVRAPDPLPDLPSVVESPRRPATPSSPKPISGPREMLTLLGVDESHLQQLFDGQPLGDDEQESLWKILYAVRRVELKRIDAWTHRDYDLAEVAALPVAHRCEIYRLHGHVTRVVRHAPIPEVVQRLQMSHYYECRLEVDGGREAIVFTHKVPKDWPLDADTRKRASCDGFFLKLADGDRPVFVSQRMAWHPDTLLGNAGMDVGLLEEVPDNTPLGTRDRECFYQLLAAMGKLTQKQLSAEAARQWPALPPRKEQPDESLVVTLLANSPPYRGHVVEFEGNARRAMKVLVADEDIVARFGIRHYYEIEMFVDLGRMYPVKSEGNKKKKVYIYPVVFCTRSLPEGMPEGDAINQRVRIAGVYLKMWTYRSDFSLEKGTANRQRSPLLIGREPVWLDAPQTGSPLYGIVAAGLFVLAMGGVCFGLWQYRRGDKQFHAEAIARQFAPREGKSLNETITPPDDA